MDVKLTNETLKIRRSAAALKESTRRSVRFEAAVPHLSEGETAVLAVDNAPPLLH